MPNQLLQANAGQQIENPAIQVAQKTTEEQMRNEAIVPTLQSYEVANEISRPEPGKAENSIGGIVRKVVGDAGSIQRRRFHAAVSLGGGALAVAGLKKDNMGMYAAGKLLVEGTAAQERNRQAQEQVVKSKAKETQKELYELWKNNGANWTPQQNSDMMERLDLPADIEATLMAQFTAQQNIQAQEVTSLDTAMEKFERDNQTNPDLVYQARVNYEATKNAIAAGDEVGARQHHNSFLSTLATPGPKASTTLLYGKKSDNSYELVAFDKSDPVAMNKKMNEAVKNGDYESFSTTVPNGKISKNTSVPLIKTANDGIGASLSFLNNKVVDIGGREAYDSALDEAMETIEVAVGTQKLAYAMAEFTESIPTETVPQFDMDWLDFMIGYDDYINHTRDNGIKPAVAEIIELDDINGTLRYSNDDENTLWGYLQQHRSEIMKESSKIRVANGGYSHKMAEIPEPVPTFNEQLREEQAEGIRQDSTTFPNGTKVEVQEIP